MENAQVHAAERLRPSRLQMITEMPICALSVASRAITFSGSHEILTSGRCHWFIVHSAGDRCNVQTPASVISLMPTYAQAIRQSRRGNSTVQYIFVSAVLIDTEEVA